MGGQVTLPFGLVGTDWRLGIDYERMRRERLTRAQQKLAESKADALLLIEVESVRYVSGMRFVETPHLHFGRSAALLFRDQDPVVWNHHRDFVRETAPWLRERLSSVSCWGFDSDDEARAFAADMRRWVTELGITLRTLAVDYMPPALYSALHEAFPDVKLADGFGIIISARMIKTPDEIACLKAAYAITAAGMARALEFLQPGVRECEVQGVCFGAMFALGSEGQQTLGIVTSDTYPYRMYPTDKIISRGEFVVLDVGGRFNGYMGDLTRTWLCGKDAKPSKEQVRIHTQAYRALKRAEAALGPGATTADVVRACGEENIKGRLLGHGIGLGNEPPNVGSVPGERIVTLEPGMMFSIEPYVGEPGVGGVRLEDNIVVTENGCEVISTFPFDNRLIE